METQYKYQINNHEMLAPFFSVVITTYNRSHLLKRALDSLLSQTETDWEAIVVDDGSTDETYSFMLPYVSSNVNIKYIRKSHSGVVMAKNRGVFSAKGKFITFLDSDDEYVSTHLESRKEILIQNPSVRFLHGGVYVLGNQYVPDKIDPSIKVNLSDCVIGGSFFVERQTLLALNGFKKIQLGEDADLYERAIKERIVMAQTNLQTYIYHHDTADSITNNLYRMHQDLKIY